MEGDKAKLTEQLNKFEDWYKAIIFDTNGTVIASKNTDKLQDGELKYFFIIIIINIENF